MFKLPVSLSTFLALAVLLSLTGSVAAQDEATDAAVPLKVPVPLANALQFASKKFKVNVVCDSFETQDLPVFPPDMQMVQQSKTGDEAIKRIAAVERRDVQVMDGVYVLRHKIWAILTKREAEPSATDNRIHAESSIRIVRAATDTNSTVPSFRVHIEAKNVTCAQFAKALRKDAAWDVRVDPEISARRISLFGEGVSPGTLLSCIGFVVNAGPQVSLRPTKAQAEAEALSADGTDENWQKRIRASNTLRPDVEKYLSKEQQNELEKGKIVTLPIAALPPALQTRALDYINMVIDLNKAIVQPVDMSQQQKFELTFTPHNEASLWYVLGVVTPTTDDRIEHF